MSLKTMPKKVLSILLSFVLVIAFVPALAFAEVGDGGARAVQDEQNSQDGAGQYEQLQSLQNGTGQYGQTLSSQDEQTQASQEGLSEESPSQLEEAVADAEEAPVAYRVPSFVDAAHPERGLTWRTEYCSDYTVLTSSLQNWSDQWIVVTGSVDVSSIVVSGTVNLILTDGCYLKADKTNKQAICVQEGATLNVYGQQNNSGRLYAKSHSQGAGIGGTEFSSGGAINIYGGTITAIAKLGSFDSHVGAGIGGGRHASGSNIAIYGGIVTAQSDDGSGIGGGSFGGCDGVRIYGGSVYATSEKGGAGIGSGYTVSATYTCAKNIYIYGGYVEAKGDTDAAAIGGGVKGDAEGLYLYGGEVVAHPGRNGSGFGSGREASGDGIYVLGGTFSCTAWSKSTGIGCGFKGTVKNINISGGTLNITAKEEGAAIGCSYAGTAEDIFISGGELNLTGGSCAAAIGAGKESVAKNIQMSGGTINATGGSKGSGIGGGFKGSCDGITISGGSVFATGGVEAAGIGGSFKTAVSNIVVSGGMVTATAGTYAAAIGGGKEGSATGISFAGAAVRALRSQSGYPSIGSGQKGTCSNITVSGAGVKVWNLSTGDVISTGGDITSKMGDFDVAITNGTIIAKGITVKAVEFSSAVRAEDKERIQSMISKIKVVPSGGLELLESQAQLVMSIMGYSEDEMCEIIADPTKTIGLSLEICLEIVDADFSNTEKPIIEFGLSTVGICTPNFGRVTRQAQEIDPDGFKQAKGTLTVTLPVPDGVVPIAAVHTSNDGLVVYDYYTLDDTDKFIYDKAAGTVTVVIDHCSHLKVSYSDPKLLPKTGDSMVGLLGLAFGVALLAGIIAMAARRKANFGRR